LLSAAKLNELKALLNTLAEKEKADQQAASQLQQQMIQQQKQERLIVISTESDDDDGDDNIRLEQPQNKKAKKNLLNISWHPC
jgi:hypothetical protein